MFKKRQPKHRAEPLKPAPSLPELPVTETRTTSVPVPLNDPPPVTASEHRASVVWTDDMLTASERKALRNEERHADG